MSLAITAAILGMQALFTLPIARDARDLYNHNIVYLLSTYSVLLNLAVFIPAWLFHT